MQQFVQQPYQQQYRMGYRLTPIASDAEINNFPVEYNGNPTYFHNQSTDEIQVRYFDIKTGLTPSIKYVRADKAQQENTTNNTTLRYDEQLKAITEQLAVLVEAVKPLRTTGGIDE